jgi:hypothetical protein
MLEIAVDLRFGKNETTIGAAEKPTFGKMVGDILVAKISPAKWGTEERRLFLITYLDDPALEAQLVAAESIVISYPYATYDADWNMLLRSEKRVDTAMFTGSDGLDPKVVTNGAVEPTTAASSLDLGDLTTAEVP